MIPDTLILSALILIPALAGVVAFAIGPDRPRRAILVGTAAVHFLIVAGLWFGWPATALPATDTAWLALDQAGLLFLSIESLLFLAASLYAVGYLASDSHRHRRSDFDEGVLFHNGPEASFTGCLLLFSATMTVMCVSSNFGLLWVALEASTLASAPLVYFHRHHRSLEATWKYLLICSVGIALALLGNFFLAVADGGSTHAVTLSLGGLLRDASGLDPRWLQAAFLFLLVGYGTKMGLAPLHTWLPDAHSESPSLVSALLSGALLNCAFLGILRAYQVCLAAGQGAFCQDLLRGLGLVSMTVAAVFILGQPDYKRLLAYSSVEHMGILALGVGLGGAGTYGALLHAVNHSLTKAMLFLVSGNILAAYQTKQVSQVRGVLRALPATGVLWVVGLLAITGSPPFGTFLSEFTILRAAIDQHRAGTAVAYLVLLAVIFVGMATTILGMAQGTPTVPSSANLPALPASRSRWLFIAPPAALACGVLLLGLVVPGRLDRILAGAANRTFAMHSPASSTNSSTLDRPAEPPPAAQAVPISFPAATPGRAVAYIVGFLAHAR